MLLVDDDRVILCLFVEQLMNDPDVVSFFIQHAHRGRCCCGDLHHLGLAVVRVEVRLFHRLSQHPSMRNHIELKMLFGQGHVKEAILVILAVCLRAVL